MGSPIGGGGGYLNLTFTLAGGPRIEQQLATWGVLIQDMPQVWEQIGDDLRADAAKNFQTEGLVATFGFSGVRGSAWAPLRPSTVRDRIRKGYGGDHPMEIRTGALFLSMTSKGGPGNISQTTGRGGRYGSNLFYAGFQHFGTLRMVARRLIGLTVERQTLIVQKIGDEIRRQARAAGLNVRGGGPLSGGEE